MDNQDISDSNSAETAICKPKLEIPLCEVLIEETECSSVGDSSEYQEGEEDMITYVVIPSDIDPERILINYCETSEEGDDGVLDPEVEISHDQCPLCGETFKNCLLMQDHFSSVHTGRDLTCQICRLQCSTDVQLMRHYKKHKYSCNLCEASFGKYADLFNHKKTHSHTLPYACNICNEAYSSTREISLHIRETHNQKRALISVEGNKSNKKLASQGIVQILNEEST